MRCVEEHNKLRNVLMAGFSSQIRDGTYEMRGIELIIVECCSLGQFDFPIAIFAKEIPFVRMRRSKLMID